MTKKLLTTLVMLALALVLAGTALAQEPNPPPGHAVATAHAHLHNTDTGVDIALPVQGRVHSDGQGGLAVSYEVNIPAAVLAGYYQSDSHSGNDPSNSVNLTLTQYYVSDTPNTLGTAMYIRYYQGVFRKLDSQVSWYDAWIDAFCEARWRDRPGQCSNSQRLTIGTPSTSTYTLTPTWSGSSNWTRVSDLDNQWGRIHITLTRGSSTWEFSFCVGTPGSGCF